MTKKVGLMTWYKYHNYGSLLQAYALCKMIEKLGYEANMINYKPREKSRYLQSSKDIPKKVKNKIFNSHQDSNSTIFKEFIKNHFTETEECSTFVELKELNDQFDAFLCGSDQVWSPLVFDEKYFLNFAHDNKIVSYAPSLGSSNIENDVVKSRMSFLLKRFKHLSVREETGKEIIKNLIGKEPFLALDPTLLIDIDEWKKLLKLDDKHIQRKYVLCYFLGDSSKYLSQIEEFAKSKGFQVYNIPFLKRKKINKYDVPFPVGPKEFVELISNAEAVFTDSYHGILFSINFKKNFYAYKRFKDDDFLNQNSRVVDFLRRVELSDRIIESNSILDKNEIDYKTVETHIMNMRRESIKYLDEAFKDIFLSKAKNEYSLGFITDYCVGCGVCANLCPTHAIQTKMNEEGFWHYHIDREKCIKCGLCKKVCPMVHIESQEIKYSKKLYAFKAKDEDILKRSSSGGFADVLVRFKNDTSYICGCQYNQGENLAEHVVLPPCSSDAELSRLQGSKYLQSKLHEAIRTLIQLPKDSKVIFFGTPCQVAGMDKLLRIRKMRQNYILIDLICHGVPTDYLWRKYYAEIVKEYQLNSQNIIVKFRDKRFGWRNRRISLDDGVGEYVANETKDTFYAFFRRGIVDMKSCYECPYRTKSSADIRIGDYWGKKYSFDKEGVSMIIANTTVGEDLIDEIKNRDLAYIQEYSLNEYFDIQYPENFNEPLFREELIEKLKSGKANLKVLRKEYLDYEDKIEMMRKIKNRLLK